MVVAEIAEDAADMGRQFRPGEGADQRLRPRFDFGADARRRYTRVFPQLHPADLARRNEGRDRDQPAEQQQPGPDPVFLERR
jgi:hypothetical protein